MENGTNGPRRGIDKNTEQPFLKANTHKKKERALEIHFVIEKRKHMWDILYSIWLSCVQFMRAIW